MVSGKRHGKSKMLHIKAGSKHAEVEPRRHGEEESSGTAVASVVKLMAGSGWLELARPLSCSTIRSRTLSLIASIYTASRARASRRGCQEVPSIWSFKRRFHNH